MVNDWLMNPALLMLLAIRLPARLLGPLAIVTPALGLLMLWQLPEGEHGAVTLYGMALTTLRVDGLSFVWGVIFHIAAMLAGLYAWHVKDRMQQSAALIYAGAAIGAVLAGDLQLLEGMRIHPNPPPAGLATVDGTRQ